MFCCRFVTFDGIAKACAEAAGAPEPELIHYNPKDYDFARTRRSLCVTSTSLPRLTRHVI